MFDVCFLVPNQCLACASQCLLRASKRRLICTSPFSILSRNAPRLAAHLTVIGREPLKAGMSVADERALWTEGRALVFDDTFVHSVSHWGDEPRYVLNIWFCHPCDTRPDR